MNAIQMQIQFMVDHIFLNINKSVSILKNMNVYTEKRDCQYEVDMYNTIRIKQSYITLTFNPWLPTSMDVNIHGC